MIAPSGGQISITAGDQQAVVVEVGGGLRSYSAGGQKLVDGYRADEMSSSGRGQVLIRDERHRNFSTTSVIVITERTGKVSPK